MSDKCPWDHKPSTIQECLDSIRLQLAWEKENGPSPLHWCIIPTSRLFMNICKSILDLEAKDDIK
jgi:hypothetical protein